MELLKAKIEAVLFVATKPLSVKGLARAVDGSETDVRTLLDTMIVERNVDENGVHILQHGDDVQFVTNPHCAAIVAAFTDDDMDAELTKPSVEALTIVAYRGPLTKAEIEAIRGVNCSLIIRNLLLRGLVVEREDAIKMQPVLSLSADALCYFGVHRVEELPDYDTLHTNAKIDQLLAAL